MLHKKEAYKMNKSKTKELDVDFIGGQGPLTKEEEAAISKYIKEYKAKHKTKAPLKRTKKLVAQHS
jgi:hypothetical protein